MAKPIKGGCRPMMARSISPTLRCLSKPPNRSWGSKIPINRTETQYNAVLKVLRDQQPLIHRYWHDATVQMNDFKNEGVAASSSWPYQANGLKVEGQPVATVFPKEGVTGWADTTMLHSEAKHPVCAYKWMNWSLTLKVQGDVAAWFGSLPVVPEGCKASALLGEKGCETNGYDQFARIHFWKTPVAEGNTFPTAAGRRTTLR